MEEFRFCRTNILWLSCFMTLNYSGLQFSKDFLVSVPLRKAFNIKMLIQGQISGSSQMQRRANLPTFT